MKPDTHGFAGDPKIPSSLGHKDTKRMVVLGMDHVVLAVEKHALPPPILNLENKKEQALLDKEDRERQAREREARRRTEALLDKRDEERKQHRIRQKVKEAMAAAEAAVASQPRTT